MLRPWRTLESEALGDYSVFRLRRDHNESQMSGATRDFFVLEAPAWINIIPLTAEGKVVLIRQYRHGTREFTLEIPGGMTDPEDASVAAAARREMLEETGYDSDDIVEIGALTPNPAIQNNRIHSFLARSARRVGEQDLQGTEEIDLELVDLAETWSRPSTTSTTFAVELNLARHRGAHTLAVGDRDVGKDLAGRVDDCHDLADSGRGIGGDETEMAARSELESTERFLHVGQVARPRRLLQVDARSVHRDRSAVQIDGGQEGFLRWAEDQRAAGRHQDGSADDFTALGSGGDVDRKWRAGFGRAARDQEQGGVGRLHRRDDDHGRLDSERSRERAAGFGNGAPQDWRAGHLRLAHSQAVPHRQPALESQQRLAVQIHAIPIDGEEHGRPVEVFAVDDLGQVRHAGADVDARAQHLCEADRLLIQLLCGRVGRRQQRGSEEYAGHRSHRPTLVTGSHASTDSLGASSISGGPSGVAAFG